MYKALGKGLSALLPETLAQKPSEGEIRMVEIDKISASRFQARTRFDDDKLQELAQSIKTHGLAQPLLVASGQNDQILELVAGERRLRAARLAGLRKVPCVIRNLKDQERFQLSLVENIQREDLNSMEEARALSRLQTEFGLTQDEIASVLGKSRSAISNTLRLLSLPEEIQHSIEAGLLTEGHARNLASLDNAQAQKALAQRIVAEKLNVREVEKIVSNWSAAISSGRVRIARTKSPDIKAIEEKLQHALGRKVTVRGQGRNGWVKIAFYNPEDLENLIALLTTKGPASETSKTSFTT